MTDTTNTNDEPTAQFIELEDGTILGLEDIIKIYEAMTPAQQAVVHFLVEAAQSGLIEVDGAEEPPAEGTPEYEEMLAKEVEGLHKLSNTVDKAMCTEE